MPCCCEQPEQEESRHVKSQPPTAPRAQGMSRDGVALNGRRDDQEDLRAIEKWRTRSKEWSSPVAGSSHHSRSERSFRREPSQGPVDIDKDTDIVQQARARSMGRTQSSEVHESSSSHHRRTNSGSYEPRVRSNPPGSDIPDVKPEHSSSGDPDKTTSLLDQTFDEGDELDQIVNSLRSTRTTGQSIASMEGSMRRSGRSHNRSMETAEGSVRRSGRHNRSMDNSDNSTRRSNRSNRTAGPSTDSRDGSNRISARTTGRSMQSNEESSIISAVSANLTPQRRKQTTPKRPVKDAPQFPPSSFVPQDRSFSSHRSTRSRTSENRPQPTANHHQQPSTIHKSAWRSSNESNASMSRMPHHVDEETKERYTMACRILKSTLMEREHALMPVEREFLMDLINNDDESASESRISAIEAASATLSTDPLFKIDSIRLPTYARNSSALGTKPHWKTRHSRYDRDSQSTQPTSVTTDIDTLLSLDSEEYPFTVMGVESRNGPPGVLTPALMEALRGFFPHTVAEENFWLKYTVKRDGAYLPNMLAKVRTSRNTVIGVETKSGHVFGTFCSSPWRQSRSWYGSGESFLWRLKSSRAVRNSRERNYQNDNEMEVYPFTGSDDKIQLCTRSTLAVGGGNFNNGACPYSGEPVGIGFMLDADLMGGETNCCATFANPRLGGRSSRSNEFEVAQLEVWTLTPCESVEEAERLEMHRMFIEEQALDG